MTLSNGGSATTGPRSGRRRVLGALREGCTVDGTRRRGQKDTRGRRVQWRSCGQGALGEAQTMEVRKCTALS